MRALKSRPGNPSQPSGGLLRSSDYNAQRTLGVPQARPFNGSSATQAGSNEPF